MTREELYNYYIVEKHSRADTAMFFNLKEDQLKHVLSNYGIIKKKRGVVHVPTWTVYKHTNKINGKCYIGITNQRFIRSRWGRNGHGYNQPGQKKFWAAIQKYGWDKFEHEVLEEGIETPELANEREKYYIALFDSFKHGYNGTEGGSGATGHKISAEARRKMGEKNKGSKHHTHKHSEDTKELISKMHKGKHLCPRTEFKKGHHTWLKGRFGEFGKPVLQYDANGYFIREWPNVYTVVKYFGNTSESCLRQCCYGNRKRYKNYVWKFKENDNYPLHIEPLVLIDVRRPVIQYDMNMNFIAEFESTIEAHRQTGASRSSIKFCCDGKYKQAGGYIWRYK